MLDTKTIKRGSVAKLDSIVGKITFFDQTNGYLRMENGKWKATGYLSDLEQPTPEEIAAYEQKSTGR